MKSAHADRDAPRQRVILACVLLILTTVLFYDQTFRFDFTDFDDTELIGWHPQLYAQGTVLDRIEQILFLDFPRLEPLVVRDLSWLLDSVIFGFNRPFGYHFSNVIYHALTLLVAFLVLRKLTGAETALLTTALVSALAVHVEPVAWIMGRKDILSSLFSLLGILFFLRFRDASGPTRKTGFYVLALLMAVLASLSKFNAVVLSGVLFLCALIRIDGFGQHGFKAENAMRMLGVLMLQVLPFFLLGLAVFVWYHSLLDAYGQMGKADVFSSEQYRRLLFLVNPLILLEYLRIVFIPEQLSAYYTQPSVHTHFSALQIALSVAVTCLTAATLILLWRFNRAAFLLLLCFFILMLPYGNWVHFGFWYANRYVYFSSFFLLAAFCHLAATIIRSDPGWPITLGIAAVTAVFLVMNLAFRSEYVQVWKDGESLWSYEVALPDAPINVYNNLTATYISRVQRAGPEDFELWLQRDSLLEKALHANDRALALELSPRSSLWLAVTHYHRGLILAYTNAPLGEQLAEFLQSVTISPLYSDALWRVAWTYRDMARAEEDAALRLRLAGESLAHFRRYFAARGRARSLAGREDEIMAQLQNEFPQLQIE